MKPDYDLVIAGAGVVGATLAGLLRNSGLRIVLLDTRRPEPFDPAAELDLRVFALSPASVRILDAASAWQTIRAARVSPYRDMHVWDASGQGTLHFESAELGTAELGYIVENRLIQSVLWQVLEAAPTITLIAPASFTALTPAADHVAFTLDTGQQGSARLVVAADGAASATRRLCGIETRGWSYAQRAVVAHLTPGQPHRDTAWQRFLPGGPLALLPLADGRVSLVWSVAEARATALLALDEAAFCNAVGEASAYRLGRFTASTARAAFPLRLQHALRYTAPRAALIGDAAHVVHPLAGQGVNLGLQDAAALADTITQALARQRDIGERGGLRRYEHARKADNLIMMYALDGLKRLFGNENAGLTWLRNNGMRAVDRFTPLKRTFMRHAMGTRGDFSVFPR